MAQTCPYPNCGYDQLSNLTHFCPSCGKPIYFSGNQDFTELIVDRTLDFTGRDWVFEKIETWLADEKGKRVLFLSGGPGSGKSAVAARLVQLARGELPLTNFPTLAKAGLSYFHFCQVQNEAVIDPLGFVKSLSLALADHFEAFALALTQIGQQHQEIHIHQEVDSAATGSVVTGVQIETLEVGSLSPRIAFAHLVREPLETLVQSGEKGIILILIDALDEALTFDLDENLVTLLHDVTDHPKDLPRQVRFLVTARKEPRVVDLIGQADLDLIDNAPADQRDVQSYAESRLAPILADPLARTELAGRIAKDGNGNFLYARYVIDDLMQHPVDPTVLTLPPGLVGVYEFFLKREIARQGRSWRSFRPLLGALVLARGRGLTRQQLAGIMNEDEHPSRIEELLEPCMQYLAGDFPYGPFRIYHQSFRDFLLRSEHYRLEADEVRSDLAFYFWKQCISFRDNGTPPDDYTLANLPVHLAEAGRYEDLNDLHFDYGWLQAKLDRLGINALLTDFSLDQRATDDATRRLGHALTQGAYVLAQDPGQLAAQLLGRLLGDESELITNLLTQAQTMCRRPVLLPKTASLQEHGLVRTLAGHTSGVSCVALTPDGTRAVSASVDHTLKIWDLTSGENLHTLTGHTEWVTKVVVTPDGSRAVSASEDQTLKVWDLASGKELRTLAGHTDNVRDVVVTPDGLSAVSASEDQTLKVWDLERGAELNTLTGHTDKVWQVMLTPDGKHAVSTSFDNTIKVWDLVSGSELHTLQGHTKLVDRVAITSDGRRVVSASGDTTLKIWDLVSGAELHTLTGHTEWVTGVAVTPNGSRVVSSSRDRTIKIWDLESGTELYSWFADEYKVRGVALAPDGSSIVSISAVNTFRIWDLASGKELQTLSGHTNTVIDVAVTPDGNRAVSASDDFTLKIWDLVGGAKLNSPSGHHRQINDVVVTPDGGHAISASADSTLKVWAVASGAELQILAGHTDEVNEVAITPDGSRAVSASVDKTLKVWDLTSGAELHTLKGHTRSVYGVALLSGGERATSVSDDETVKIWDLTSGKELSTMSAHTERITTESVTGVAVALTGTRVIFASTDHTLADYKLKVLDLTSGAELQTLPGHSGRIRDVAVTPDGNRAVSASWDGTLKVWDLESIIELRTLIGHSERVCGVAVTPDGSRAVSASEDNTLKVWDLATGACLATFYASEKLFSCAVTPDGQTVVTAGMSGRMHFLRLEE